MTELLSPPSASRVARVRLTPSGLDLGGSVLPLLAGSVHYWRLSPSAWEPALQGLADMGLRLVDVYVPWAVHERADGELDFGERDPRLDVLRFLDAAHALGLRAIVRPGPHINAELTCFGIPERAIWDERCQARSPNGRRVVLPVPPLSFPVPSYASRAFLEESARWLRTVAARLSSRRHPDGPIVMMQVDNEGALYFRDGVYDQDWHPDAIAIYRDFLRRKYGSVEALRERYLDPSATFEDVEPPRRFAADTALELVRHLDWAEAQEQVVTSAMRFFRAELEGAGLGELPCSHNLPLGENATPLDPAALGAELDLLGLDYYHKASRATQRSIARRTSELALRAEAGGYVPFSCELGAGFPPFFMPLHDKDNAFTALTACAYGLRGFNVYMAVERDRWIGAPIDQHGQRRPGFEFWKRLCGAIERTRFRELTRPIEVALVVPRSLRRLWRALHAFGPLSSAWFEIAAGGAVDACVEDELDFGAPRIIEAAAALRELERRLDDAGIPYAVAGSDCVEQALQSARWVVVACAGAMDAPLLDVLSRGHPGTAVSFAPYLPDADASFRPLSRQFAAAGPSSGVPLLVPAHPEAMARALLEARAALDLSAVSVGPAELRATIHTDRDRVPRVGFVINPDPEQREARLGVTGLTGAEDLLDGTVFHATNHCVEFTVAPESVRMLALEVARPV